jgi:hypothetical protein
LTRDIPRELRDGTSLGTDDIARAVVLPLAVLSLHKVAEPVSVIAYFVTNCSRVKKAKYHLSCVVLSSATL